MHGSFVVGLEKGHLAARCDSELRAKQGEEYLLCDGPWSYWTACGAMSQSGT